LAVLLKSKQYW